MGGTMKKLTILLLLALTLSACGRSTPAVPTDTQTALPETEATETTTQIPEETEAVTQMKINVQIGDATFTATMEDNAAVREFVEMLRQGPVTIHMEDYSGFEKVGPLGRSLTTENRQTTTNAGDIVLYSGNQIVMFYGSNSWSYTRLGRIDDLTGWKAALGSGSITAVFTLAE